MFKVDFAKFPSMIFEGDFGKLLLVNQWANCKQN